jgi:hypothetical protein
MYHYPPLVNLIWNQWRTSLPEGERIGTPITIPKQWQKHIKLLMRSSRNAFFAMAMTTSQIHVQVLWNIYIFIVL